MSQFLTNWSTGSERLHVWSAWSFVFVAVTFPLFGFQFKFLFLDQQQPEELNLFKLSLVSMAWNNLKLDLQVESLHDDYYLD